jgi:hypothetical protein
MKKMLVDRLTICLLLLLLRRTGAFPVGLSVALGRTEVRLSAADASNEVSQGTNRDRQKNKTQWIACSSTTEITRAVQMYLQNGDIVAELGSQLRETSKVICETIGSAGKAMLVDVERKFPNKKKDQQRTLAMRREGGEIDFYTDRATFVEIRSFECWRDALFFQHEIRPQYNVLVVDMSTVAGNDLDLTTISLIKEFIALNHCSGCENSCRAVIVKSGSLHNLARRLHHAQRVITGAESIDYCNHSTTIIGSVGVKQYRQTIPLAVRKGDVCIEVGCHLGTTTALIHESAMDNDTGGCIGVDVGPHIIKSARKNYPHLQFEVGDGFKTGVLARMKEKNFRCNTSYFENDDRIYDVVFVDIGGLSGSEGLLEALSLLSSISNSLNPRCIVIKSLCIRRLASCLSAFSDVWRNEVMHR